MTAGINASCHHSKKLATWANPYDDNVAIKYVEVAVLLLDVKLLSKGFGPADDKIFTGKNGLWQQRADAYIERTSQQMGYYEGYQ